MNPRKILRIVKAVFSVEFDIDRRRVTCRSALGPDVGMDMADGYDCATLAFALEDAFRIRIPGAVPLRWKSVKQVVGYIVRRLS